MKFLYDYLRRMSTLTWQILYAQTRSSAVAETARVTIKTSNSGRSANSNRNPEYDLCKSYYAALS